MLPACFGFEGKPGRRERRKNAALESSECLVIAQGKTKRPPFPGIPLRAKGGFESSLASLPAPSPQPSHIFQLCYASPCLHTRCLSLLVARRGAGPGARKGSRGPPAFGLPGPGSPEPAGARMMPCPSPPPVLQSLRMLPYSCHVLPPSLLKLVA